MTRRYTSIILHVVLGSLLSFALQAQTTQLKSQFCDQAASFDLGDLVQCDNVAQADQFQFRFVAGESIHDRNSDDNSIFLYEVDQLAYATTYDVYVRWRETGGEWSAYGDTCQLVMDDEIPTTQLRDTFCLETEPFYLEANILAYNVVGADSFQFAFSDGVQEFIYPSENYSFMLYTADDLEYGVTYDVYVRSIIGTDLSGWGDTCQITLSDMIPMVDVRDQFCDIDSLYPLGATVLCDNTPGYDAYKWQFVDDEDVLIYFSDNYSIQLFEVPGIGMGHVYEVSVAAVIGQSVGEYGNVCILQMASNLPGSILEPPFCSTDTLLYFDDVISADTLSSDIDSWVFRIFGNDIDQEVEVTTNSLDLSLIEGLLYDSTYNVTVQAEGVAGVSLNADTCTITFAAMPLAIDLSEESCDETYVIGSGEVIECELLLAATDYEFRFSPEVGDPLIGSSINEVISINEVDGLLPGLHDVDVRGFAGGQWSEWGMSCQVNIVDTITSVMENAYPQFSIYPNPSADGRIYLNGLQKVSGTMVLRLHTLSGRSVFQETLLPSAAVSRQLNVATGTYLLSLSGEDGVAVRRLVIR